MGDDKEAIISQKRRYMDAGKTVLALVAYINEQKNLTPEQIVSMMQTYALIQNLLMVGALDMARTMISAIVPDDVIVTEQDKIDIIAEISAYLPGE